MGVITNFGRIDADGSVVTIPVDVNYSPAAMLAPPPTWNAPAPPPTWNAMPDVVLAFEDKPYIDPSGNGSWVDMAEAAPESRAQVRVRFMLTNSGTGNATFDAPVLPAGALRVEAAKGDNDGARKSIGGVVLRPGETRTFYVYLQAPPTGVNSYQFSVPLSYKGYRAFGASPVLIPVNITYDAAAGAVVTATTSGVDNSGTGGGTVINYPDGGAADVGTTGGSVTPAATAPISWGKVIAGVGAGAVVGGPVGALIGAGIGAYLARKP